MAESLNVSMEVTDAGSIEKIDSAGDSFEKVAESADEASSAFDRFDEVVNALEGSAGTLKQALEQAFSEVPDISGRLTALENLSDKTGASIGQLAQSLELGASKEQFISDIRRLQDQLESGEVRVNDLDTSLRSLGQQFNAAFTSIRPGVQEELINKTQSATQEIEEEVVALEKLKKGNTATAQEIEDTIRANNLLADSVADANNRLNKVDDVIGNFGVSFKEAAKQLDFTSQDINEFNSQLNSLEERLEQQKVQQALSNEEVENAGDIFLSASGGAERYTESITGVENRTESQEQAILDSINALELQEQQLAENRIRHQQLAEVQGNTIGGMTRFGSTSANVNEIIFSTGDAIQDAQFGIRGMGNNIAFMAENFVQAGARLGSFKAVLKGVFASLAGPLGVIVALQTLIALLPSIIDFFSSSEEEANKFKKAVEDAAGSLISFSEDIQGIEIDTLAEAERLRDNLQERADLRRDALEISKNLRGNGAVALAQAGLLNEEIQTQTDEKLTQEEIEERRQLLLANNTEELERETVATEEAAKAAENSVRTREATLEAQRAINREHEKSTEEIQTQGVNLQEVHQVQNEILETQEQLSFDESLEVNLFGDAQPQEITSFLEGGLLNNLESVGNAIDRVNTLREDASGERLRQLNRLQQRLEDQQKELENLGIEGEKAFTKIGDVNIDQISTLEETEQAISFLENKLQTTDFGNEQRRKRIRQLLEQLRQLRNEADNTSRSVDSIGDAFDSIDKANALSSAIADNMLRFAEAVGEGENVIKSFGKAVTGILAQVGTAIGKQLIAQGSALIASALIPGQQGNAVVGAKLVGAGTALIAASSALSGAVGGSSSSSRNTPQQQDDLEGGGEGEFSPGRKRGGPVESGTLYRTHGMGEREFFIPSQDGMIATANQIGSATNRSNSRVEVTTRNRLEGSINGPDLFELDVRLKEVEQFKNRFAEQ